LETRVVYREGISALLASVRARFTPRVRQRLLAECGVDEKALAPSYPWTVLDQIQEVLCQELWPGVPMDQATFELGRQALVHYGDTVLGKALFGVVRLLGPLRIAKRLPSVFRQTNNYAELTMHITSETSWELEHNEVGRYPHQIRGNMQAAGELFGWKDHKCELLSYDGHRARYRVSWSSS
jgi:uncharacterized protein (TIGR02265 family)